MAPLCPNSTSPSARAKFSLAKNPQPDFAKRIPEPCVTRKFRESSVSSGRLNAVTTAKSVEPCRISKSVSPVWRSTTEQQNQKKTCESKVSSEEKPPIGRSSSKSPSSAGPRTIGINGLAGTERTSRQNGRSKVLPTCNLKKDQAKARRTRKESNENPKKLSVSTTELASPDEVKKGLLKHQDRDCGRAPKNIDSLIKRSSTSDNIRQKAKKLKAVNKSTAIVPKTRASVKSVPKDTSTPSPLPPAQRQNPYEASTVTGKPKKQISSSSSFSTLPSDLSTRKRPREKPQTIVKHPIKTLETIHVNTQDRKAVAKKRILPSRERCSEPMKPRKAIERGPDCEKRKSKNMSFIKPTNCKEKPYKISVTKVETLPLTIERIKQHQEATRTDTFFQHLFLRGIPSPPASQSSTVKKSLVMERARMFQNLPTDHFKSEPSLRSLGVYLANKRPVSNSRFKNWERESLSSRSSSPYGISWPGRSVFQRVSKFDSLVGMNEFGSSASLRGSSPSLMSREGLKERSLSEPPLKIISSQDRHQEVRRPVTPSTRTASPSPTRSAASRRIRSFRQQDRDEVCSVKTRTRSASEAENLEHRRTNFGSNLSLAKSTGSLESPPMNRDDYQRYMLETLHTRRKSERYKDLHDFYASLERMGELEKTTSSGDLRPRLKDEEIIDYDRWKEIRSKERAKEELKILYGKLKDVQKDKDFLFSTRDVEKQRWRGDCGLRCKERSVENIRESFQRLENEENELESTRRKELTSKKDIYKPLWRGNSVANVADNITKKAAEMNDEIERTPVQPALQKRLGGSKKFWSSLSIEQVTALKNQLNEIYGTDVNGKSKVARSLIKTEYEKSTATREESIPKSQKRETPVMMSSTKTKYEIIVPSEEEFGETVEEVKGLHVRCHSMLAPDTSTKSEEECTEMIISGTLPILKRRGSIGNGRNLATTKTEGPVPTPPPLSELDKKRLSLTLGKEILDKVTKRQAATTPVTPRETRGAIAAASVKPKSPSSSGVSSVTKTSPRTCYSLEAFSDGEGSSRSRDKSDFLLVLTPNDGTPSNKRKVENVLEEWSRKPPLLAMSVSTDNSIKNPMTSGSEFDSATESSETSVKTVVRRGSAAEEVPRKVEFFESIDKTDLLTRPMKDKPSQRSDKSLCRDGGDVEKINKITCSKLSSAQSFADLKELFGEIESARYATLPFRGLSRARSTSPGSDQYANGSGSGLGGRSTSASPDVPNGRSSMWRSSSRSQSRDRYRARSASPCPASDSTCSLESLRQRSVSPDPERYWRAYLNLVKNGSVRNLRAKFESLEELTGGRTKLIPTPKRFQSDPELTRNLLKKVTDEKRTYLKAQEVPDVAWLRRKYEPTTRGRARRRAARSPPIPRIPLRLEDLSMPRINVISKTAELKDNLVRSGSTDSLARKAEVEELEAKRPVGRIREKFESFDGKSGRDGTPSLLGEMFTSAPNVHELRDIAPYLAGRWVAHKYPSRRDNARSLSLPPDLETSGSKTSSKIEIVKPRTGRTRIHGRNDECKRTREVRTVSSSPVRARTPTSILKQPHVDPFADQPFDPSIHRPRYRYQPPPPPPPPPAPIHRRKTRPWWPPIPTYTAKPTVTFEGPISLQ